MKSRFFVDQPVRDDAPWFNEKVEVKKSSVHGLGVFAKELINKNEIFECCPVIVFDHYTMTHLYDLKGCRHLLHDYVFGWYGKAAIGLGYGSVYNHSNDNTNASHRMNDDIPGIEFVAKRDIQPGEEILIHYWKGRIRGEFTDSGTMVADGRVTEKMKRDGIASYRKKKKR